MVDISSDLDNAFKSDEREIKTYVKIEYNKPKIKYEDYRYGIEYYDANYSPAVISRPQSMFEEINYSIPIKTNYATLENNFLKLDGSLMIPQSYGESDNPQNYAGYISQDIISGNTELRITFNANKNLIEGGISGMTLYFIDNIPGDLTLNLFDYTEQQSYEYSIIDNQDAVVNFDFGEEITISGIQTIKMSNWSKNDRRVRLQRVEFGYTEIYQNEEIIDINIQEQIKKFCDETPENECSITLNNIDNKFDILNPYGITKYLNDRTQITPFIGAKLANGEVEYVNMGIFYLDDWHNNNDSTTTLIGKNLIKKIKDIEFKKVENVDGPFEFTDTIEVQGHQLTDYATGISNYLKDTYGINNNIDLNIEEDYLEGNYLDMLALVNFDDVKLLEYLQNISIAFKTIMYIDRNNTLRINRIRQDYTIEDLSYNELLDKPKITKIKPINVVRIKYDNVFTKLDSTEKDMEIEYVLKSNEDIIKMSTDYNKAITYIDDVSGGSVSVIENNNYIVFYKITGNQGDTVNFKQKYIERIDGRNESYEFNYNDEIYKEKDKNVLEFDGKYLKYIYLNDGFDYDSVKYNFANYYLNKRNQYEFEFEFNGNPKFEAGDIVYVESDYAYTPIFIESITHKFDGGLSCSVKGIDMEW